jgi:hypothetical protein
MSCSSVRCSNSISQGGDFVVHGVRLGYQARSQVRKGKECNATFKSRSQVVSRQANEIIRFSIT